MERQYGDVAGYGGAEAVCGRQATGSAPLEELHSEETLLPRQVTAGKL